MRPRFSLRTLFVVTTLIAALFGWRWKNYSHATMFAELLSAGEFQQAETFASNPEQVLMFDPQMQNGEWKIAATVDNTSTLSNWWRPGVVAECSFTEANCGQYLVYRFRQTMLGFRCNEQF